MKDQKKWMCNSCNARNSTEHNFCIKCSAQRPAGVLCSKCGAHLNADQQFCFYCGTPAKHTNLVEPQYPVVTNEKHTEKDVFIRKRRTHHNTDQANPRCAKYGKPSNVEASICEQCKAKKRRISLWIRSVAAVLVVALLSGIAVHFVGKRTPKVKNAEQAISVLKDLGEEWGYENAFSELTENNMTTIDGDNYYRLQQNYEGIPIYGKTVVCSTDRNGNTLSVTGNVADIKTHINLAVTITKDQIVESIQNSSDKLSLSENDIREFLSDLNADDLCIYVEENGTEHLAYVIDIGWVEYVVDAKKGTLLTTKSLISNATGYLASDKNFEYGFYVAEDNGQYILCNESGDVWICDLDGRNIENTTLNISKEYIVSDDNIFGNTKNEDGYETGAKLLVSIDEIHSYFSKTFGFKTRSGYIIAAYNDGKDLGFNASGGVASDGTGVIALGKYESPEIYNVLGHEYSHVVCKTHACFSHQSIENFELEEGLCDIFGIIVEAKANNLDTPDWEFRDNGGLLGVYRDISNPEKSGNATKLTYPLKNEKYYHSTIISHPAYLMWNGIDGNAEKKIDLDTLAKLWYRAMLMMPSDCDFVECRTLVEVAASNMNLTDLQKQCVSEAFDRVGIQPASKEEYLQLVHMLIAEGGPAIKGTVYEVKTVDGVETVVPVSKATVTVYDEDSSKVYKKLNMKNKDGSFEIELPAGTYSVSITAEGYIGQTITVELNDNQVRYFSIAMKSAEEKTPTVVPTEAPVKGDVLSGKCGDNLTWTLENGVLTISGTGAMYDYDPFGLSTDTSAMPAPWYDYAYNNEVTAIQIGDGVTYIGSYAFACCWNIDTIRIPGNVKQIGNGAFHACSTRPDKKLKVIIEEGVKEIGYGAFSECFSMDSIILPDSITYIGDCAFWNCRLTSITIPKNVTYIGSQVFYGVSSNTLKNVYFTGNAPQFADDAFLEEHLTAYYPGDNTTWTSAVMKDYGGHVNWVKEHKPITLGSFKNLSEAYTYAINSKPNDMFSYGMLEDIDGDGTDELILGYCDSIAVDGTEWAAHCYSIYDYKNEKLICSVDKEVICYEVAGNSGRIGVVYYKNKPTLMRKEWEAPHGTSGDLFENYYMLYDPEKYQPLTELRVDQHNEGNIWYEYYVDNSEVTQAEFEDELKNYKYLALNSDGRVNYSYPEKSFDELKEYLASLVAPQTGMELDAYRPIVEKYNVSTQEQSFGWYSGILIDLDNDNVQELVLRYLSAPFEDAWWSEHKLSVYDYENGKVITKLDGVTFGEIGGAGEDAYATILYKSGNPYIMTYNDFGETSSGGSMKPNRVGIMTIYDGKTCKEVGVYRIERWDNVMSYQIDQRTVSEKEFVSAIEQYQGVEVICDLYQLIESPETFVTVSKLLQQMK